MGAIVGAGVMFSLWKFTAINGYLYTASGICTGVAVGFVASLASGRPTNDLTGLTIYTLHQATTETGVDGERANDVDGARPKR